MKGKRSLYLALGFVLGILFFWGADSLNTWLNNNNGYQGSNILWSRAADTWTMSYIGGLSP